MAGPASEQRILRLAINFPGELTQTTGLAGKHEDFMTTASGWAGRAMS
jgi:hypothetical protein